MFQVTLLNNQCVLFSMEDERKQHTFNLFIIALFKAVAALALFMFVLLHTGCASTEKVSKKNEPPLWVIDYMKAYPTSEYIAATGTGNTAEESIVASTAALSRYFSAQISALTQSNRTMRENANGISKEQSIVEDTSILSDTELKALHTENPYFVKQDNTYGRWISVSYIKRSEAWTFLEPELNSRKNAFDTPYDKALETDDKLLKVLYLSSANNSIPALEESLAFAKVISPSKALWYADENDRIKDCASSLLDASLEVPISVEVEGDNDGIIYSSLVSLFGDNGITVTNNNSSKYKLHALITTEGFESKSGYFYYPTVTITLITGEKTIFSYSKAGAKTGATEQSVAETRSYRTLKKELETSLFTEIISRMGGNK